ncbi:MAG: class I SAM-dependent methyltransferase [Coriobacteriales bacterium]|jgi:SAM-dependent methyltransferase|nr:class I SAM-dependent methyltransferase [Coriobacteriales bacterium]
MDDKTVEIARRLNNDFYRRNAAAFSASRKTPWLGWERCVRIVKDAKLDASGTSFRNLQAGSCSGPQHNLSGELCHELPADLRHRSQHKASHSKARRGLSVFDLGCGNLRFEQFLSGALPEIALTFYAVDNCEELVDGGLAQAVGAPDLDAARVHYQQLDIMECLCQDARLSELLTAPLCDLSVAFGFMHHIPRQAYRKQVLTSLIDQTRTGGLVVVSFWQFLNNALLAKKAQQAHARAMKDLHLFPVHEPARNDEAADLVVHRGERDAAADLAAYKGTAREGGGTTNSGEAADDDSKINNNIKVTWEAGDYLLGWDNIPGAYRYCHSFSQVEIDWLSSSVAKKASVVARFKADGRSGDLNTYLILRVNRET